MTLQTEQSAKIAKVSRRSGPMLFLSPRARQPHTITAAVPGGTSVRANLPRLARTFSFLGNDFAVASGILAVGNGLCAVPRTAFNCAARNATEGVPYRLTSKSSTF